MATGLGNAVLNLILNLMLDLLKVKEHLKNQFYREEILLILKIKIVLSNEKQKSNNI
jgi:hypothetical protein